MGGGFAGLTQRSNSSGRRLRTNVGQLAYWSAVAVIFAWAAWLRFDLPLDPIVVPNYVTPALKKLAGGEFGQIHLERTVIYPGFVYLLVRIFGDFRAITIAQNLLGLSAGAVFLLTWKRIRDFIPRSKLPYSIYRWFGLLAAAVYLLSGGPLLFERDIRPEGIGGFLVSINLYLVIQFSACCFLERRQTATVAWGIAAVFSSVLLASVKPSFRLTAIVALLSIAIFLFRPGWLWQKIALAGGAALAVALLSLPGHFLLRHRTVDECYLPTQLFVIHANLIRDQMRADLESGAKVPYPWEWLSRVQGALATEISKSSAAGPHYYSTLGFNPDYLMWNQTSIVRQLQQEFGDNTSGLCAFYRFYYRRLWQQRPLLVLKKIAGQLAIFYGRKCPAYRLRKSVSLTDEYDRSVTLLEPFRELWTAYPPAVAFMNRTTLLARSAPVIEQPVYVRRPHQILEATYLVLLLIALALSAFVFMQKERRRRFGWLAALILFTYAYSFANCFEVAIVHSLANPRYTTVQMFIAILSQILTIVLILEILMESRAAIGRKRKIHHFWPSSRQTEDDAGR
jgi:hypothetical protein